MERATPTGFKSSLTRQLRDRFDDSRSIGRPEQKDYLSKGDFIANSDIVKLLSTRPHQNLSVGGQHEYSNLGYALLGSVIEAASGKTYASFMRDEIFTPLGMESTLMPNEKTFHSIPNRAVGYTPTFFGGRFAKYDTLDDSGKDAFVVGKGGIHSNADDMKLWMAELQKSTLIKDPKIQSKIFEKGGLSNGQKVPYGYGLELSDLGSKKLISHTGRYASFESELYFQPETGVQYFSLCNEPTQGYPRDPNAPGKQWLSLPYEILNAAK